jgi:hypothetical protein
MNSRKGRGLKKIFVILCTIVLLGLTSCITSEMSRSWRNPYLSIAPFKSILIISMKQKSLYRRIWEDSFCMDLRAHGVQGIASYLIYPDSIPGIYAVMHDVKSEQYDGVLLIDNGKSHRNFPPDPKYRLQEQYQINAEQEPPPRLQTQSTRNVVEHEVQLYTTSGIGQLYWIGTGTVYDPSSRKEIRESMSQLIIGELAAEGIIPPILTDEMKK